MLVKPNQMRVEKREKMRDGNGTVILEHFFPKENLPSKTRLAARIILEKGVSIGSHTHSNESEIYYCIQGSGKVIDGDGIEQALNVGDATLTCHGGTHYLEGTSVEPCIIVAIVTLD